MNEKLEYCLNMISVCRDDINKCSNERRDIKKIISSMPSDLENIEERRRLCEAQDVLYGCERDFLVKMAILKNNSKIALYEYTMPIVVDVLNKYTGKRIGEKTSAKIKEEFLKLSGCSMYIQNDWSGHKATVALLNDDGYLDWRIDRIEIGFGRDMFKDGKLLEVKTEDASLMYVTNMYIDDVDTEVKVLKALNRQILYAAKELANACVEYNQHVVGDIPRREYKHYYEDLMTA